ncbi:hypothetical protein [Paraburkholderia sediminicola]|uniref:hypothetical protein n=1 Tax=Paraburkholderia sediminicola TaxID=458836 RepID=UPI0038BB0716
MAVLFTKKVNLILLSLALFSCLEGPASAQTPTQTTIASSAPAAQSAPTKAERKAARKQVRAKKNAELKKLEANGYSPSRNDPNYPQDLQNAEKKAAAGNGASQ